MSKIDKKNTVEESPKQSKFSSCQEAIDFLKLSEKEIKEIYKSATMPYKDDENKVAGAFVVFLDRNDRLRYCEDKYVANEKDFEFRNCIGKITSLNAQPLNVEDESSRRNFHEMLSCAYAQASHGNLPSAYMFVGKAKEYYKSITTERARKCSLNTTGWIVIVCSILIFVTIYVKTIFSVNIPYYDWLVGMYMGILGASVSIWQRYGRIEFTGYAPKYLYKLEIGARIIYGLISSIVLIAAVKDGWITTARLVPPNNITLHSVMIMGFLAGFFERMIPSIAEQFAKESGPKSKKIYKPVEILEEKDNNSGEDIDNNNDKQ